MSENLKQMPDNVDTIEDLVKHSLDKDYNKANEIFGNIMSVKMNDVLDQTKAKLAGQIYNDEPEDEEIEDEEMEDEKIENEDEKIENEDEDADDKDGEDEEKTEEPDIGEGDDEGDDDGTESDEDEDEVEGAAV